MPTCPGYSQAELDSSGQDLAKRQQLEMQVDTASKEVQQLQGQLSDLNAVLSNHVASTKLGTLHDQHAKMLASNHAERQRVDAVYANRAAKQRQTKEVQSAAEQIQKQLEQKVHEMSIEQQQEYYNLQVQHASPTDRTQPDVCHPAILIINWFDLLRTTSAWMNWLMHACFPQSREPSLPATCSRSLCESRALAGDWHLVAPTERCTFVRVCRIPDSSCRLLNSNWKLSCKILPLRSQRLR